MSVRSVPADARIEDSDKLNLTQVIVSFEVGKVRLDIGVDLYWYISVGARSAGAQRVILLCLIPNVDNIGGSSE